MRIINKKPALFEKSNYNIWTDPYIQQQILKKHLDLQSDGASRKQESILKIVNFVLNIQNLKVIYLIWDVVRDYILRFSQMKIIL